MLKAIRKALRKLLGYKPGPSPSALEAWQQRYAKLRATYDAARTSTDYQKIWENADQYDADSAHSKDVRHTLIKRHRYEIGSNGYSDGIAQTYANHLIGVGPSLRMQTGSQPFNQMIEAQWHLWWKATHGRRRLWCMAHAKHSDGEAFGVLRRNPGVRHPIPLELCLYEAEQFQTPYLPFTEEGYIDGMQFDKYGNATFYDLMRRHPGTTRGLTYDPVPERLPADSVLHWFKLRRPGQHRAVPECSSTLNVGAASRRWREAVLGCAETAADFTMFLKTQFQPDSEDLQYAADFEQQEISKRMMTALPVGYDPFQMKAEQPTTSHSEFHKSLVNEQARAKNMPYNVAACDSSSYNYASGRLDHQTYYTSLDLDRADCDDLVLDPLFDTWFDLAIARFGWLGGNPDAIGPGARLHIWDWPKHRVADIEAEANANSTRLKTGQAFLHTLYSDAGLDFEDELEKAAVSFGITVDEMRARLLDVILPPAKEPQPRSIPSDEALAALFRERRNGHANGAHANGN